MSYQIQPGDKVSYINDNLSGIVKRIIDKKKVLLLLDDGFEIPANISELIVTKKTGVDSDENSDPFTIIAEDEDQSDKIYFGAVTEEASNGMKVKAYMINTTTKLLQFAMYRSGDGMIRGISHGEIEPSRALEIFSFPMAEASENRNLIIQYMQFEEEPRKLLPPVEITFKLKPVALFKDKYTVPVIKKKGFLLDLSYEHPAPSNEGPTTLRGLQKPEPIPDIIDLHLEELSSQPKNLSPAEAIQLQMRVFNQALEKAMAQDLHEITFIHGVGKGVLKTEIRKILASNVHIQGFADADPKKFGSGATIVYLKSR